MDSTAGCDGKNIAAKWGDGHRFSPAPRHRRRIMISIFKELDYNSVLDVGCAQPNLLEELHIMGKQVFGCDISDQVIESNRINYPFAEYAEVDVSKGRYPINKTFDLVVASEVLEHIPNWESAVKNIAQMSKRFVLITVPGGKIHAIDRIVGHTQHFQGSELSSRLEAEGFNIIRMRRWGFPIHTLYKYAINAIAPKAVYESFGAGSYGPEKRLISELLYWLFFLNVFDSGGQIFILAEKKPGVVQ